MPELPEVETVCRGLRPKLVGRKIVSIRYHRPNLRFPFPKQLPKRAANLTITDVTRHSKYILIHLSDKSRILLHLGMSGRLSFHPAKSYTRDTHDHVVITLNRGPLLIFNDARRFGVLDDILPHRSHRLLDTLGLDPFDPTLTPAQLHDMASRLRCDLKAFLMNQKYIAGLGNIYVSEALFRARLLPTRIANRLTLAEAKKLLPAIRKTLDAAITAGGSSLRDYVQVDGELGYFQDKHLVYGREDQPCPRCKTPITRIIQAGRSSFMCEGCQKQ
jgi:formamidopyrimidine-DNA glycosylase